MSGAELIAAERQRQIGSLLADLHGLAIDVYEFLDRLVDIAIRDET